MSYKIEKDGEKTKIKKDKRDTNNIHWTDLSNYERENMIYQLLIDRKYLDYDGYVVIKK